MGNSSHNYRVKNAHIMAKGYWESLGKLMAYEGFDVDEKVRLVKFKKNASMAIEELAQSLTGMDGDKVAELLAREYTAEFKPVNAPLEKFSPEDLFRLEGIINTEV